MIGMNLKKAVLLRKMYLSLSIQKKEKRGFMTQTTANRQLTLLVSGVLRKHKIDNLQLEIDLVSSIHRMYDEAGRDVSKMVSIREEILDSFLAGAAKENEITSMEKRVKDCMGISIDGRSRYENMLKFLVKKEEQGQKVEQYAKWCKENSFERPKPFQIASRPALLMETWTMAFPEVKEISRPTGTGFYA